MSSYRLNGSLGIAVACVVAIALSVAPRQAFAADPIRIFLPTSPIAWGFYLADKKGYFKAEGVDVNIRVFSSGAEGAQAFQALGAEMLEAGDMPALLFVNRTASTTTLVGQVAQSSK